jgi:hypothetical protein
VWIRRFPRLPAMLLLVAVVLVLNIPTLRSVSKVSVVDEREHLDFMLRGSHGRIGHTGQVFTQESLRELCSRGSELFAWPPCKPGRLDPLDYAPETRGRNIAAQDPPYYLVTGLTARSLRAVTPGWESLVTWGRVLGSVWLLLGMYLVLRLGDLLDLDRKLLVAALILVAAIPAQLQASTAVNPDSMAFLAGAAILLTGLAWERGRVNLAWFVVVSALAIWLDRANAVALVIVLAYLAFRGWVTRREAQAAVPSLHHRVAAGIAVAITVIGVVGTWQAVERRTRPEASAELRPESGRMLPPRLTPDYKSSLPIKDILGAESLFGMLPPVRDVAPPHARDTGSNAVWYKTFASAAQFAILGVLGAAILGWSATGRIRSLAGATVIALVITTIPIHLYHYYVNGYFVQIAPRFALSALPAIALVFCAIASRSRIAYTTLGVIAIGLYATALLTLV